MCTLVIFSDIRLYREGLALILSRDEEFRVDASAETPLRTLELVRELRPAVVLVDMLSRDSGLLAPELFRMTSGLGIVALTLGGDDESILRCAETGILGFVSRDGSVDDLKTAIRSVARGELICSARVAGFLARRLAALDSTPVAQSPCNHLTAREMEILRLVERGLVNKEIARGLHISVATVKNHVHSLLNKLGVESRQDAAEVLRNSWASAARLTLA